MAQRAGTYEPSIGRISTQEFQISMQQKMLAACSGSLLTSVVITPFDVIRVRLQKQSAFPGAPDDIGAKIKAPGPGVKIFQPHSMEKIPNGIGVTACCKDVFWFPSSVDYCVASELDTCAVEETSKQRLTGTWQGLRKISQNEGITTLWRGLGLTLFMSVPANVVYFIGYEYLRDNFPVKSDIFTPLMAGALARTMAATVISPVELIKTRLQSVTSSNAGQAFNTVMAGIKDMVASQGFSSMWRGLGLTLSRDVPFSGIYWSSVELIRSQLSQMEYFKAHPDEHFIKSFVAGSVGGSIAAVCTTPFDVGKTRRQVGHHSCTTFDVNMLTFLRTIAKEEGMSALFVGLVPRLLKVAPACAIMISSYEVGKQFFSDWNRDH